MFKILLRVQHLQIENECILFDFHRHMQEKKTMMELFSIHFRMAEYD